MSGRGERGDPELAERYRVDMVTFAPGPHDVRVARGGWVFYVRAVRGAERLVGPSVGIVGSVVTIVLTTALVGRPWQVQVVVVAAWCLAILGVAGWRWRRVRDRPWRVGVVRGPDPASWNAGPPTALLEEELARGEDPAPRVAEIAERARAGRFDPHV